MTRYMILLHLTFYFTFISLKILIFFFFFNDPAPTEISPFPLPDALPISRGGAGGAQDAGVAGRYPPHGFWFRTCQRHVRRRDDGTGYPPSISSRRSSSSSQRSSAAA